MVGIDGDLDATDITGEFDKDVDEVFNAAKTVVLSDLKDAPLTSGGAASSPSTSVGHSLVRREPVSLPKFEGDEKKTSFLDFPVWKEQWDLQIKDYDEHFRIGMLKNHIDEAAKQKIIGYENNYVEAMKRLSKYYGDNTKIVSCVMRDVMSPKEIGEAEYVNLLSYSVVLENNYNRLKVMGYEHEMSNSTAMASILRKFPRSVGERWHEHLSSKTPAEKAKPFPILIEWLISRKEVWEGMATTDQGRSRNVNSHYQRTLSCYECGEEGHRAKECPSKKNNRNPTNPNTRTSNKKPRVAPTVKKFWCALHKGDPSRRCFPDSCQELRRLDIQQRVQLIKDNKDCSHCLGDHKPTDCPKPNRVCGGGRSDRGCTKNHAVHELLCVDAKVFAVSMNVSGKSESVALLIMQVRTLKNKLATTFYDGGSDACFVREEFAVECGFKGCQVNLCVTTLGGEEKNFIEVTVYTCYLVDVNGQTETFEAYGMSTITGSVTQIDPRTIKRLFPHLSEKSINKLMRGSTVDFLIGMTHPSWHPERAEQAIGDGDFWVFRGKYGMCVGGRHQEVKEETCKSKNLFVRVHQSYQIATEPASRSSHELEYCQHRIENYSPIVPFHDHPDHCVKRADDPTSVTCSSLEIIHEEHTASSSIVEMDEPSSSIVEMDEPLVSPIAVPSKNSVLSPIAVPFIPVTVTVFNDNDGHLPSLPQDETTSEETMDSSVFHVVSDLLPQSGNSEDMMDSSTFHAVSEVASTVMLECEDSAPRTVSENVENAPAQSATSDMTTTSVVTNENDNALSTVPQDIHSVESTVSTLNSVDTSLVETYVDDDAMSLTISQDIHDNNINISEDVTVSDSSGSEWCAVCLATKTTPLSDAELFFRGQLLGTVVDPRCGGCKCSKCPIPGMKYSFKEQQEYETIQKNLFYCPQRKRWITTYPWATARSALPKNEKAAYQALLSLERRLQKNPELAAEYCKQIQAMIDRGVAIVISEEELQSWEGAYYYLNLLGVKGKSSDMRVVFDAARRQGGYPSLNDCLLKGPDNFMNNGVLPVLLGFRNGRVAAVADLRKFHNQVHLVQEDVHMQRFYWRDLKTDEPPKTYAMVANNFGVKPANCIATSALHKSADLFADKYPLESEEIKQQTYVDDELIAAPDMVELRNKTKHMDEICEHANMPNKGWTYSGDETVPDISIGRGVSGVETISEKVLGALYNPGSDKFYFLANLKLKTLDGVIHEISTWEEFQVIKDTLLLTRKVALSNVARIFDPVGFLVAILLESKLLIRESWCGEQLGWDDPLPSDQQKRWIRFLSSLLSLGEVLFERSLWPEGRVVGLPMLIVFCDGSALAFGAVAFIRWELEGGGFWCRLIMAKCRVAPKNILSIPRMELNGAVLGNRIKNFLMNDTNFQFSKVYVLVDSSTVLGYLQKECGTFRPFEGVRVAEFQSTSNYVDGKLGNVAWVSGKDNPADWCTKPRTVAEVRDSRFWKEGPEFLKRDESTWPLIFTYKKDNFEGELRVPRSVKCLHVHVQHDDFLGRLVHRSSSWKKSVRTLSWILRFVDSHFVRRTGVLSADEMTRARTLLIKFAQRELIHDLEVSAGGKGRYAKLCPVLDTDGIWRVGSRMRVVPFTLDAKLPALLPPRHRVTLLLMRKAHQHSHLLQDGTVARFRCEGFWTVRCGHLAKSVVDKCVDCRKLSRRLLKQKMGEIPEERLQSPYAWGYCQMDLVGPFKCRSDVNSRANKKTWGIVIEDANSGAVHLDVVSDYSAQAVIFSLHRFASLRGWPGVICTDPGSQLESASGQFDKWWSSMGDMLRTFGGEQNFKWKLSPADSPWRQGKAERRIALIKKQLALSIGDTRVTPLELQTTLMEIANMCNERPIGLSRPRADGTYEIITPNQLLLGRSINILPDNTPIVENMPVAARFRLVHLISTNFWKRWSAEVSPGLVVRQKWHEQSRNLCVGDLVLICEPSKLKAKYKLGVVDSVTLSADNIVRSVVVRYVLLQKNAKGDTNTRIIRVSRSVQRLVLILPVEEQHTPLEVTDDEVTIQCTSSA